MRNILTFSLSFFLMLGNLLAQDPVRLPTNLFIQDMGAGLDARIREIPPKPPGLDGSSLLQEDWAMGNAYLFSGEVVRNLPLRYDARYNIIEILFQGEIKILQGDKTKGFEWRDPTDSYYISFVNAQDYVKQGGEHMHGFFEVVVFEETVKLFQFTDIEILESNYVPALDAGNRDKQIVQKKKYYVALDDEKFITKVSGSKKQVLMLFGEKEDEMGEFIKEQKLKFKKRPDLVRIFLQYSEIKADATP